MGTHVLTHSQPVHSRNHDGHTTLPQLAMKPLADETIFKWESQSILMHTLIIKFQNQWLRYYFNLAINDFRLHSELYVALLRKFSSPDTFLEFYRWVITESMLLVHLAVLLKT
jgi:hypothetical protein